MTIGTAIRLLRQARGWTLKKVSMRGGCAVSALNKYERCERVPKNVAVEKIAAGLGVSRHLLIAIRDGFNAPNQERLILGSLRSVARAEENLANLIGGEQ